MSAAGPRGGPFGDARVSVQADLRMDLGGAAATLTGDGDRLVLATERPGALWDTLAGAPLPLSLIHI